jgi:hypothetical protein
MRGFQGQQRGVTKWVASACAGALVERDDCERRDEGVKVLYDGCQFLPLAGTLWLKMARIRAVDSGRAWLLQRGQGTR